MRAEAHGCDVAWRKRAARRERYAARRAMRPPMRRAAALSLREVALACPEVARAPVVAAYVSIGTEPGTGPLIEALRAGGARVLLPVLRADRDLDWASYDGAASLGPAGRGASARGLVEPTGARLGVEAIRDAAAVLVPAVAVDVRGVRLGRGGGSYDRVLARLAGGTFSAALLYDGEVVDVVPAEAHDRAVDAAITPSGVRRFA